MAGFCAPQIAAWPIHEYSHLPSRFRPLQLTTRSWCPGPQMLRSIAAPLQVDLARGRGARGRSEDMGALSEIWLLPSISLSSPTFRARWPSVTSFRELYFAEYVWSSAASAQERAGAVARRTGAASTGNWGPNGDSEIPSNPPIILTRSGCGPRAGF